MNRINAFIARYIYSDSLTLDARILNMICSIGMGAAIIASIVRLIEGAPLLAMVAMLGMIVSIIILFILVNRFNVYAILIPVTLVALGDILWPIIFFANGGLTSGMAAFYVLTLAITILLAKGRLRVVLIIVNIAVVFTSYILAIFFAPEVSITTLTPFQQLIDVMQSILVAGFFLGFLALFQRRIFEIEKQRADAAVARVSRNEQLRQVVNQMATTLLGADASASQQALVSSMEMIARAMNVDIVRIWQSQLPQIDLMLSSEDDLLFQLTDEFPCQGPNLLLDEDTAEKRAARTLHYARIPGLNDVLSRLSFDKVLTEGSQEFEDMVQQLPAHRQLQSYIVIPVFLLEQFWGFVSYSNYHKERDFDSSEVEILRSASMLLVSAKIQQETLEALVSAREEAQINSRAKGNFLANMSHEIRTPMNAIIGMTDLAMTAEDTQTKDQRLGKIKEASAHLLGVINDILDMSKIEADKLELVPEPFSFKALVDRMVSIMSFRIEEKRQKFVLRMDKAIPDRLVGDSQRLAQVITNLISNAVKFTPDGGNIEMAFSLLNRVGDCCVIEGRVTDDGIGISEEQKSRLFNSFEQADSSTSRRFGGTGLGLAISKRVVELMGGEIEVSSQPQRGSTFTFTVQLRQASAADEQQASSLVPPRRALLGGTTEEQRRKDAPLNGVSADYSGSTIMVAEDVDVNFEIIAALLESTGASLEWARNGLEAVEKFKQQPQRYSLIFMDMQMPELNGLEATAAIRSSGLPNAGQVPIIAMTANVFQEDIDACLAAGMNAHIGKPLDFDRVIELLEQFLEQSAGIPSERKA
ncbi:MAG: response regulator [Coriobacteriales bacterium]|jgi:signal transduction histidine kinase/ActR/RegA family two-component response regulator|nr:response regulator [Coriobacteriales bacterium]